MYGEAFELILVAIKSLAPSSEASEKSQRSIRYSDAEELHNHINLHSLLGN